MKTLILILFIWSCCDDLYAQRTFSRIIDEDNLHLQSVRDVVWFDSLVHLSCQKLKSNKLRSKLVMTDTEGKIMNMIDNDDITFFRSGLANEEQSLYVAAQNIPVIEHQVHNNQYDFNSLATIKLIQRLILDHNNPSNHQKFGPLIWIEGIGSPNGLLYYYDWLNGSKTDLLCYFDREKKRFTTTQDQNCQALIKSSDFYKVIAPQHTWYTVQFSSFGPEQVYNRYGLTEDSIMIGDHFYFPLLVSADSLGNNWIETKKYLRELGGKLWLYDSNSGKETLILDMTLEVGATFNYAVNDQEVITLFVKENSFITLEDGLPRKVLKLSCSENQAASITWIEGIGNVNNLFDLGKVCVFDGLPELLNCFYNKEQQVYFRPDTDVCWKKSVNVTEYSSLFVKIYPNPGNEILHIKVDNDMSANPIQVQILDGMGKLMYTHPVLSNEIIVDTSALQAGMYLIKCVDPTGKIYYSKWIKE